MLLVDERMKLCSEMLQGIRIVKYFAWERPYMARVMQLREQETYYARIEMLCGGGCNLITVFGPLLAIGLTICAYFFGVVDLET